MSRCLELTNASAKIIPKSISRKQESTCKGGKYKHLVNFKFRV